MADPDGNPNRLSDEDIEHLAKKHGVDEEEVRELIDEHGNDRTKIEAVIASLRTG